MPAFSDIFVYAVSAAFAVYLLALTWVWIYTRSWAAPDRSTATTQPQDAPAQAEYRRAA